VITTRRRGKQRLANLYAMLQGETPLAQAGLSSEDRVHLADAFNALSDRDREALMLVGWDGLSIPEAAQILDLTPQSFSLRLHRARKRLEARMEADQHPLFHSREPVPNMKEAR
jgi:RNA polymerase sigma factor (sigma-70 family)